MNGHHLNRNHYSSDPATSDQSSCNDPPLTIDPRLLLLPAQGNPSVGSEFTGSPALTAVPAAAADSSLPTGDLQLGSWDTCQPESSVTFHAGHWRHPDTGHDGQNWTTSAAFDPALGGNPQDQDHMAKTSYTHGASLSEFNAGGDNPDRRVQEVMIKGSKLAKTTTFHQVTLDGVPYHDKTARDLRDSTGAFRSKRIHLKTMGACADGVSDSTQCGGLIFLVEKAGSNRLETLASMCQRHFDQRAGYKIVKHCTSCASANGRSTGPPPKASSRHRSGRQVHEHRRESLCVGCRTKRQKPNRDAFTRSVARDSS